VTAQKVLILSAYEDSPFRPEIANVQLLGFTVLYNHELLGRNNSASNAYNDSRRSRCHLTWLASRRHAARRKVTGRTKTEIRDKLKKLQAETDAGLKTSASYTVANGSPGKIIPRISRALAAAAPNRAGSAYVHHGACGQQRPG
jgi:hypothetical protein